MPRTRIDLNQPLEYTFKDKNWASGGQTLTAGDYQGIASAGFLSNVEDGISVRPPYTREDYERYRPNDAIPTKDPDIMRACRAAYDKVGIIRSVVDLMTEIAVEGMELISPHPSSDLLWKNWAERTEIVERAERFANHLCVEGNVAARAKYAQITTAEVRKMKRNKPIVADHTSKNPVEPGQIPVEYIFYDPAALELIGGDLALFTGIRNYGLKITSSNFIKLRTLFQQNRAAVVGQLPPEILAILDGTTPPKRTLSGEFIVPIPPERLYVAHYKKRDSNIWAKSFIYAILHDVVYNEKLRLAKISALDNWYNAIRVWKLGDHKEGAMPHAGHFARLANILENHPGGTLDIIWDSMIEFQQEFPPIEKLAEFEENYESMLLGLGIHRSLVGGSEKLPGTNSAFIGLRNLMKRIDAIRREIVRWVEHETDIVAQNLGLQHKPKIKFSLNNLFDQGAYFKLLIDLNDRDLISNQALIEKVGEMQVIEEQRIRNETEKREAGEIPAKKGQFITPEMPDKTFDQQKEMADKTHEQGMESQKRAAEQSLEQATTIEKLKPKPAASGSPPKRKGRPAGSKDKVNRNRRFQSKTAAIVYADNLQTQLDGIFDADFLVYNQKDNKRQLTTAQKEKLEDGKIDVLASAGCADLEIGNVADCEAILDSADPQLVNAFKVFYKELVSDAGKKVTAQQLRTFKSLAFAEIYS